MTKIVIIGAGFGGVAAAQGLVKKFGNDKSVSITLIDKRDYLLYAPNLYEVATAEEEFTTIANLKKSIAIPLSEIFSSDQIQIKKAEVTAIDSVGRTVAAGISKLPYDYLILAAGSSSEYYNIAGAKQYALSLKTLAEAFAIRNRLEFVFEAKSLAFQRDHIRVVIAGGGYTGCELAAQLADLVEILCWKYDYPADKVEIAVVEAANHLLSGLAHRLSEDTLARLRELGVRVLLSMPIYSMDEHFINFLTGEKLAYDVAVWSAGVRAAKLPFASSFKLDNKGRVMVNDNLQSQADERIFAIGDCACILDSNGQPLAGTAFNAIHQGQYLAAALLIISQNRKPKSYVNKPQSFIVALGGRWAILKADRFYWAGWSAYFIRMLVAFRYYRSVVGWWKALKYIWLQWEEYGRND